MIQNNKETTRLNHHGNVNLINIRKVLLMMVRNWYFYVIGLLVCFVGAYFYMQNRIPTFYVSATILIEEERGGPGADLLEGFAVRPGVQNLDNQILLVSSYSLVRKVVEELPFEIEIYRKGLWSQASYYPMSPIRVKEGSDGLPYDSEFMFKFKEGDQFYLKTISRTGPQMDTVLSFGQIIRLSNGSFSISPQPELEDVYISGQKIFIRFYTKERLTESYQNRLDVENATRDGSIIRLSLQGTNRIKDVLFLDKLADVYINNNLDKKNHEAKRVIEFIDAQLVDVSESLMVTETELQDFRSKNMIMDISAQAEQIITQAVVLENEKARLNLERNYFSYLKDFLSNEDNEKAPVSPASMGIGDPLLANLMQELAGLQAEYFSNSVGERNPMQSQLELRIRNTKQSIDQTLEGLMLANQMALDENNEQINRLNADASGLPIKERKLLGFERKFNLNNVLYTFLMQRRAEAQIQAASNAPDNEMIDPARAMGPVSPIGKLVYIFAFALAIGIPTLLVLLKEIINNKITCEEDLKMITKLPVVAHFPHSRLNYNTVVLTEPSSRISEAFRSLRTRLEFFIKENDCPTLLVTSSISGEGKTFTAINLASAYSLAEKKTLLIGFDLRRPTLSKSFKLNSDDAGLTNYLIGKRSLDDVIHKTDFDNLYVIPSGPIPPNPGELSSLAKVKEMFEILKTKFDYIIVDSPPIGVVSDIYSVASIADAVLMMVRHDYSKKNVLSAALEEVQGNGIEHLSLLVNDVKTVGSSYRYAYKYKYNYISNNDKLIGIHWKLKKPKDVSSTTKDQKA